MNNNETSSLKLKVVIIGDAAVGKTSLAVRFTKNAFAENYMFTVGGSFCSRSLEISNKKIIFQIWDTAGTERFRSIVPFYLRNADVALVTYDVSESKSFRDISQWLRLLQESGPESMKRVLIGNKADLKDLRSVTTQEGQRLADAHGLYFIETSAKTGQNVDKVFADIGSVFVNSSNHSNTPHTYKSVVLDPNIPEKTNKCCF